MPKRSRMRAATHSAHGACTWPPNGREHGDAPVADLVAEALDDDGAVVGDVPRGLRLLRRGSR